MVTEAEEAENAIVEVAIDDLEKIVEEEKSDSNLEMLDNPPVVFMTPKKKKTKSRNNLRTAF
jgi:AMMECR1 domain-containing protein